MVTLWPSHEVFDARIATPERDALTASDVHRAVDYRPITRYEVAGGYLNVPGLAAQLAIGLGGLDVESDDHRLLDRASFVYDALFAWCARQVAAAGV